MGGQAGTVRQKFTRQTPPGKLIAFCIRYLIVSAFGYDAFVQAQQINMPAPNFGFAIQDSPTNHRQHAPNQQPRANGIRTLFSRGISPVPLEIPHIRSCARWKYRVRVCPWAPCRNRRVHLGPVRRERKCINKRRRVKRAQWRTAAWKR